MLGRGDGFGRVAVGVPYWKGCGEFFQWWGLLLVGGFEDDDELLVRPDVPVEVPIPMSHNAIVKAFLTTDADTLCLIEDDHVSDQDVVRRMRTKPENRDFDIVCASYTNRRGTPIPMGWYFGDGQGRRLAPGEPEPQHLLGHQCVFDLPGVQLYGTQEYDGAAVGLVLVRRWVLEAIREEQAAECRENPLWFSWDGHSSQDVGFYSRARRVRARVGVDRDNWIGHVGKYVWTVHDFMKWRGDPEGTYPTEVGQQRHPPYGWYDDAGEMLPCTCTEKCADPCRGECGCKACGAAYHDFLSGPGDW